MEYWKAEGWTEHQIRHWFSSQWAQRDDQGKIIRTERKGNTMSADELKAKMEKQAIIDDRKTYREAVCDCFPYMDYRPRCPMARASRSPNFD